MEPFSHDKADAARCSKNRQRPMINHYQGGFGTRIKKPLTIYHCWKSLLLSPISCPELACLATTGVTMSALILISAFFWPPTNNDQSISKQSWNHVGLAITIISYNDFHCYLLDCSCHWCCWACRSRCSATKSLSETLASQRSGSLATASSLG